MRQVQSDRILVLLDTSLKVETEIETHAPEIAGRLDERFAPRFEGLGVGSERPDFLSTLLAMKGELQASREALAAQEQRHMDLLKRGIELRGERGKLTDSLYGDFSAMRRTVEQVYDSEGNTERSAFVLAGIQGPTAQKPVRLLRQVDLAVAHLLNSDLVLPEPRFGGVDVDPRRLARGLRPRAQRLGEVIREIKEVGSQLNATRKEKNRAVEHHKETFLWVARGAESFFQLAGESELAERIRPSVRRRGRRAADVGETDEASGESSGDESGSSGSPEA